MPLAIEIRNGYVNLVEANVSKSEILVKKVHSYKFDETWISEAGIVKVEEFAGLLKKELAKAQMKDKNVTVCVNNNAIIYRELNLPVVDEVKIPLLVRSEMMNNLNLTPDYIMDYVFIEELKNEKMNQFRVLGVALHKEYIESILDVLHHLNLKAKVIDGAANAMIKYVDSAKVVPDEGLVIVTDIEESYLRQYLFENGNYALSRNNRIEEFSKKEKEEGIASIIDNINKMIQFSYTRGQSTLTKVILTGNDDYLNTIKKQVKDSIGIECEILAPQTNIRGLKYENRYVNAIGGLMRVSK